MSSTEKMFPPGFVPGKDEAGSYVQLYADPAFTLADRIKAVDLSMLTEHSILILCKRNSHDTGVGIEDASWLEPVEKRYSSALFSLQMRLREMQSCEIRFREAIASKEYDIPAAYKALRAMFVKAIGEKVALEYVKRQLEETPPEERERQNAEHEAREKAWNEKLERRKKIYAIAKEHPGFVDDMRFDEAYYIDKYDLTDADLDELEEMLEEEREEAWKRANIPYDHIERYDYRDGYYSVPIITEKIILVRKEAGLNQRDFAKLIGYPNVNKYGKLEKGDLGSPSYREKIFLIKDVCDATCANPYWLEEDIEETVYDVEKELTATTRMEASPRYAWPMYATNKVIREWWMYQQKMKLGTGINF